jgi:serine/threonine protein kinase
MTYFIKFHGISFSDRRKVEPVRSGGWPGQLWRRLLRSSVADYEVIEEIGQTASGHSRFLCRPPERLHRSGPVVVAELALDAGRWHQMADHLGRLVAIGAPGLLELLEVGPDLDPGGAGVYLVAEAAPGGSLVEPVQPLDMPDIASAVATAAEAAHSMHDAGLAHGAIDGQAIVFTERGPVLSPPPLDLPPGAVAKSRGWRQLSTIDPDLLGGESPSRSSDVWSLGATLHSALSTVPLYEGLDADEPVTLVQRIVFGRPGVDPALPAELTEVISACLDPDPSRRPQTAAEVARMIRARKRLS